MKKFNINLVMPVILGLVLLSWIIPQRGKESGNSPQTLDYSTFIGDMQQDKLSEVSFMVEDSSVSVLRKDSSSYRVRVPVLDATLQNTLAEKGVRVLVEDVQKSSFAFMGGILIQFVVYGIECLIFIVCMKYFLGMIGGGKHDLSLGKRSRPVLETAEKVLFPDVAGCDEVKQEVAELVDYLREPQRFQALGAKLPKGVLMIGPPGTGKTLLAKAIAGEAKVPFFSVSGSEFVEVYAGVGASRVRDLFTQAKRAAPCIVFIDEIDSIGRKRSGGIGRGGGHQESDQTLNQMLVEMDGFEENVGVLVIAATNRSDVLDPALLRPGRFDRHVTLSAPDIRGREAILAAHSRKIPLEKQVDLSIIARGTPGLSGAELANLVNESALVAVRERSAEVTMQHFDQARDKLMMGVARTSLLMSDREKEVTAYHEAGHVIVGRLLPGCDPVYKVTILPRGRALGVTVSLPEADRFSYHQLYFENRIAMLYGGRIAEELIYGREQVSTGASNDMEQATQIARQMVVKWGFSEVLGPISFSDSAFQDGMNPEALHVSNETATVIEAELKKIISRNYAQAHQLLTENIDILHAMKAALLDHETLNSQQLDQLMARHPLASAESTFKRDTRERLSS